MFTRDALLLIGHGSSSIPDAARPLLTHAETIRANGQFAEVSVGMLKGQPDAGAAFEALTPSVIHVLPFFLEDGYFTRIAIPELIMPRAGPSRVVRFHRPIGTHAEIALLLRARLDRHCEMYGTNPASLFVLVVGHGSSRAPGRARAIRSHVDNLERSGHFGWVRAAFLEEPPRAAETLASARGHTVAVIGYLANAGLHAASDLPALIAAERAARGTNWPPVHDLGSIGADPALPGLIESHIHLGTQARR